jgi:hypothetical protein
VRVAVTANRFTTLPFIRFPSLPIDRHGETRETLSNLASTVPLE